MELEAIHSVLTIIANLQTEAAKVSEDLGYKNLPLAGQNAYNLVKWSRHATSTTRLFGARWTFMKADIDEEIQKLIVNRATSSEIQRAAIEQGMVTMRQTGI